MRRLAAIAVCMALAGGAQAETRRLVAGGPRPVYDAVLQLNTRHDWSICYEETRLRYAADLYEGQPKPGVLVLNYNPAAGRAAVAVRLVESYNKLPDATSRFQVVEVAGRSVVKVSEVRDEKGRWTAAKSPLECPVTLKKGNWPLMAVLEEMGRQLSLHAGFSVWMTPGLASNGLMQRSAAISAEGEPARTVVARMLAHTRHNAFAGEGWDAGWHVICGGNYGCGFRIDDSKPPRGIPPPPPGPVWPVLGPLKRPPTPIK